MSSNDVLTQAAQRAQRIIADHCFGPFDSEHAEERAMDIAAVCVDDMIEDDLLISAGLVRGPVTAEQIENAARELHRRDLGDVNAWLHEPEHRRDMWRSKARTAAKALGLSVAEGGDDPAPLPAGVTELGQPCANPTCPAVHGGSTDA